MRHSYPDQLYPTSYYDEQMCLKPPLLLWVAALFLSRALTLPLLMAVGHFSGVDASAITAFRAFWSLDSVAPSLIAALILYVLFRRVPSAPAWVRWVWARGQIILAAAAILDIGLLASGVMRQGEINNSSLFSVGAAVMDLYFLLFILAARRVRDAFSEFPAPVDEPEQSKT